MSDLWLTDAERARFCDWLEREAHADDAQAKQIEALGPHGKVVADHKRRLCAAKLMVLRELQSIESVSIDRSVPPEAWATAAPPPDDEAVRLLRELFEHWITDSDPRELPKLCKEVRAYLSSKEQR